MLPLQISNDIPGKARWSDAPWSAWGGLFAEGGPKLSSVHWTRLVCPVDRSLARSLGKAGCGRGSRVIAHASRLHALRNARGSAHCGHPGRNLGPPRCWPGTAASRSRVQSRPFALCSSSRSAAPSSRAPVALSRCPPASNQPYPAPASATSSSKAPRSAPRAAAMPTSAFLFGAR